MIFESKVGISSFKFYLRISNLIVDYSLSNSIYRIWHFSPPLRTSNHRCVLYLCEQDRSVWCECVSVIHGISHYNYWHCHSRMFRPTRGGCCLLQITTPPLQLLASRFSLELTLSWRRGCGRSRCRSPFYSISIVNHLYSLIIDRRYSISWSFCWPTSLDLAAHLLFSTIDSECYLHDHLQSRLLQDQRLWHAA